MRRVEARAPTRAHQSARKVRLLERMRPRAARHFGICTIAAVIVTVTCGASATIKVEAQDGATGPLTSRGNGRPLVVLIHGRDQGKRDPAAVQRAWLDAFAAGMRRIGADGLIPSGDVQFVWYGDIYADDGVDRTCPYVQVLPPDEQAARGNIIDAVRRELLHLVSAVPGLERAVADLLVHDTEQYLRFAQFRCATDRRLAGPLRNAADAGRPVILVAHSMGSLVALSVLRRFEVDVPSLRVAQFVTIGSQLGISEVLSALEGSHVRPPVPVPASVRAWTNYTARGDLLGIRQKGFFVANNTSRLPVDRVVDNGKDAPHAAVKYLEQSELSLTVARSWCSELAKEGGKGALCARVAATR